MTSYIKKLPTVFQTVTEKKFFDATFDQVFSKKDSDLLLGYIGRRIPGHYNPVNDFYLPEPSKDRTWWQLEATAFSRNADSTKSNIFFYDDLLSRINYYGGNTLNQDRLFESEYYSWAPPIDFDMFVNYQNYYWVDEGLATINLHGVTYNDIVPVGDHGLSYFNTNMVPGATPTNLTLTTGLSIKLVDDLNYPDNLTVENFGGCAGIQLVPQRPAYTSGTAFEFLPWDGMIQLADGRTIQNTIWDAQTWDVHAAPSSGDYITIERGSVDQNAWSRTNKWFNIDAINTSIQATNTTFPANATRALRPIIQFSANLELYNSGTQFKEDISYGFRDDINGAAILRSAYQGQSRSYIASHLGVGMQDGQLVMFMNDISAKHTVWVVSINAASIVTFTSYGTAVVNGDIVFATNNAPYDGAKRGETWYYDINQWVAATNDKITNNQPPLFQLYDHNNIPLDDQTVYPLSTFAGNKIFSYKTSTTPGAAIDPVLKLPIIYTSLGQSSDIMFQNNLITHRYTYNSASSSLAPINGYYYYSDITSSINSNDWNLHTPRICNEPMTPINANALSKQRVIDNFVVGYGSEYAFKLSVIPYGFSTNPLVSVPDIVVSVNNIEVKNATVSTIGYTVSLVNNVVQVNLEAYLIMLLSTPQVVPPVVQIDTYTHGLLDATAPGYFEIPQQLEANPSQLEISELSASSLINQFTSIIQNQDGFDGVAFGGPTNYRDTRKNKTVGSFILQNVTPMLKTMLISSNDNLDIVTGLRFSQDEYTKFKNKYLRTAQQLINREFNPVQYHNNTIIVSAWVDEIIKTVNISKEFSSAFAYSYMIANGSPKSTETRVVPANGVTSLTNYVDLSDPRNALYVYDLTGHEKLLLIGVDYTFVSAPGLPIIMQFSPALVGKSIFVAFYTNPITAYIPSTPTKIGAYGAYIPKMDWDTSYTIPTWVIIGHDGSKSIAYGEYNSVTNTFADYRDALLLELEKRIYNLIQYKFRHEYNIPLRIENVKSGYFRKASYSRAEYLDITESYLNKWSAKNLANYRLNDWDTASKDLPNNSLALWKLYNYYGAVVNAVPPADQPAYFLPGNWKGIFQYYYDTIYPATRPWEMLGFTSMPSWWNVQYTSNWSSTNTALWADLEAGIVRKGPSAIFDPITLVPQPQEMWARPGLSAIIPVDTSGNTRSIPQIFNITLSGNMYAPFAGFNDPWQYGDGGPVEQAWISTSSYAFSVQEFLYLMRPAAFGELLFDTVGTTLSQGKVYPADPTNSPISSTNRQYVQNDIYSSNNPMFAWMRPKNTTQIVHAETIDGTVEIRYGYQRWISDYILFLGKDVTTVFGQKVRTLDVNLANKLAGFTNKDTTTTYIESVSATAKTTSLLVPTNNFEVILHTGQPIKTYSYSGVIVRVLENGTFVLYGYDLLNSSFTVLSRSNAQLINITIGGTPAEFKIYASGETYYSGDIVRYNGIYYQSTSTLIAGKFNSASWQKLKSLPVVGGMSVTYRPISETTSYKVPYGAVFNTVQEVFDVIIGWGAYLETQGWQFTDVSPDTNQLSDWLYCAKQFLFWMNSNWAPDASIQLSPAANNAILTVEAGYPDDVESISNGIYSILDKYGVAIPPRSTTIDRDGLSISVAPADLSAGGIYFLQIHASETEHILIFDNSTSFGDVVYDPLLRERQQRLRFNGFRSNGWYGKKEASGYLIIDNQLVPNYDTIVDEMRYYYDPDTTIDNPSIEALGRHLIGYESKSYLDNLQLSNDVQYLFYQGAIRQKGTVQAFDKLFRSTKVQGNEVIEVYEEWALKLGDFGNTIEQVSTEFILKPEQNSGEVIVARLNFIPSTVGVIKQINIINAQNTYTVVPKIVISAPDSGISTARLAKAYAILNSAGVISRIDISDPGYGYLTAPSVSIDSGTQPHALDRLYAVWQGEIIRDVALDNIIEIDIDDTTVWTVRPPDPTYSLEFPVTPRIDYSIPNAGYVNYDDVRWTSFDAAQTYTNWGTAALNPTVNDTVWVAKTFIDDWCVYKMSNMEPSARFVGQISGVILTVTSMIAGSISIGNFVKSSSMSSGTTYITAGDTGAGGVGTYVVNLQQDVLSMSMKTDVWGTIEDAAGNLVLRTMPDVQITPQMSTSPGAESDFGNSLCLQIVADDGTVSQDTNYVVGFEQVNYQDPYTLGYRSYNLLTLDGVPITSSDIGVYAEFTNLLLFKTMRFADISTTSQPYITQNDKVWVDNIDSKWHVMIRTASTLIPYRIQESLIDTLLFESAQVYNTRTQDEVVMLPIYDPFKGVLPAPAKQNISYMMLQDPARYNVTGDIRLLSNTIIFGEQQVGKIWWDLSTVRYSYYEQPRWLNADGTYGEDTTDNLVYRRDNWGSIFPGSVISIYEWTKSALPPAEYTGTGTPRSITTYVQLTTTNRFTNIQETNFYFWVLNSTTKPNIENRTLAGSDIARLLISPKSQGFVFFSPIQQTPTNNAYMLYNVQEILSYKGNNVQIRYRLAQRNDQTHTQWKFFREGDKNSVVTDQYWDKMADSLCGYTKTLPASTEWANSIPVAAGVILPVPDPTLGESEKYGIGYRPLQGMFVNLLTARKIFVQSGNELLKHIPIRDNNSSWNNGTDTDAYNGIYWSYTDWYEIGFENAKPTAAFTILEDAKIAMVAGKLSTGTIVEVLNGTADGRFMLYNIAQSGPTQSLQLIGIETSAIKLLNSIYTDENIYNLSLELRHLLTAIRTEVMIDNFIVDQNELYFSMLNYVFSEQKSPDWVFKTSYIYIKENNIPLLQSPLYTPDQIDNIIGYITDSKPYHTQIRDYTSVYTTTDTAIGKPTADFIINVNTRLPIRLVNDSPQPYAPWGNRTSTALNDADPLVRPHIVAAQLDPLLIIYGPGSWDANDENSALTLPWDSNGDPLATGVVDPLTIGHWDVGSVSYLPVTISHRQHLTTASNTLLRNGNVNSPLSDSGDPTPDTSVWNATNATPNPATQILPGKYTSVTSASKGGVWYANTPVSEYLKQVPGSSIP